MVDLDTFVDEVAVTVGTGSDDDLKPKRRRSKVCKASEKGGRG